MSREEREAGLLRIFIIEKVATCSFCTCKANKNQLPTSCAYTEIAKPLRPSDITTSHGRRGNAQSCEFQFSSDQTTFAACFMAELDAMANMTKCASIVCIQQ